MPCGGLFDGEVRVDPAAATTSTIANAARSAAPKWSLLGSHCGRSSPNSAAPSTATPTRSPHRSRGGRACGNCDRSFSSDRRRLRRAQRMQRNPARRAILNSARGAQAPPAPRPIIRVVAPAEVAASTSSRICSLVPAGTRAGSGPLINANSMACTLSLGQLLHLPARGLQPQFRPWQASPAAPPTPKRRVLDLRRIPMTVDTSTCHLRATSACHLPGRNLHSSPGDNTRRISISDNSLSGQRRTQTHDRTVEVTFG